MEEIIFKDNNQKKRFEKLYNENKKNIWKDLDLLIKNIIVLFKMHSENEEYIVLNLIHWLIFSGIIKEDHKILTKMDLIHIGQLRRSLKYELNWDYKKYLDEIVNMNNDLFLLKIIIKYSVLSFEKIFKNVVKKPIEYYKNIGYIIPYLTIKESPFLGFFQDFYFKKIYPKKFQKVRKYYIEKVSEIEFPWEHMFTIVNSFSDLMWNIWVIGKIKVRRKTYFSIYNKLVRKKWETSLDNIWVRILFINNKDLRKFANHFEERFVFMDKKDFISTPKPNWYKSLHYRYISPYRDTQIVIELQLRTIEIDNEIRNSEKFSHFMYTVKENKWSKLFKEVHVWYNYIQNK